MAGTAATARLNCKLNCNGSEGIGGTERDRTAGPARCENDDERLVSLRNPDRVVLFNTGFGNKYTDVIARHLLNVDPTPRSVDASSLDKR
jgi:hypothetical protein